MFTSLSMVFSIDEISETNSNKNRKTISPVRNVRESVVDAVFYKKLVVSRI